MISNEDKYTNWPMHPGCQVDWYLPKVQNSGISMEVGSMLHICHVWVEWVGLGHPEMCCLLCLTWPSQMALSQQAHCLQMALKLRCLYAQPLPWVHLPWTALSWGWWVTNSFYVGSSCIPPHPWGIPHKTGTLAFSPHISYFSINSLFYGGLWRQLHGLGLCPQPPRLLPCFSCHSLVYVAAPLLPGMIWPSNGPIWHIPSASVQTSRW